MSLDFDFPLIKFSADEGDWWTIGDAFEGVQIFGGIGSGKSSGSGKTIAISFLENHFGGLVLCAKKGEAVDWLSYAIATNRWEDVIVMGKKNKYELWSEYLKKKKRFKELEIFVSKYNWSSGNDKFFNPLDYEMNRAGEGAGEVFNLSNLFMELYKMGNRFSGGGSSGESERYWDTALKRCLNRMLQVLILAGEEISVDNMRRLISSAPTEQDLSTLDNMTEEEYLNWVNNESYCGYCITKAELEMTEEQSEEFGLVKDYFMRQFAKMPEKTRSTIEESFLGLAEPFMSGILKTYFSRETNLKPEESFEGKIIILDFAVKEYLQAGVYAQGIFKLLWQQAIERRDTDIHPTPAFLWVDESQYFVNEYDTIFQTTARSSRACTVFLTQNISNYYSQMGGESSKSKVNSLLGNLSTKIFHANNDSVTNEWASDVIGKDLIPLTTSSQNKKKFSFMADTIGKSESLTLLPQVLPKEFTTLWTGGKRRDLVVQAIIQMKGRKWSNKTNYWLAEFTQQ